MTAQMPRSKTSAPNRLGEDMRQSYLSPATIPAGIYDRAIGFIFGQIASAMAAPKKYQNCCFFLVVFVGIDTNAVMMFKFHSQVVSLDRKSTRLNSSHLG